MKQFLKILMFLVVIVFFTAGSSMADTIVFDDQYANWPDQVVTITSDTYGSPQIQTVEVTTDDDGYLQTIEITMVNRLIWDSLFINTGIDNTIDEFDDTVWDSWDYFIQDFTSDNSTGATFYSVSSDSYTYTTSTSGRVGHVNGIDSGLTVESDYLTSVVWSGAIDWVDEINSYTLTYTFVDNKILLGQYFTIGYSPYCANDVFLSSVPEPTTMLLFGAGLIGLAAVGRRKFIK